MTITPQSTGDKFSLTDLFVGQAAFICLWYIGQENINGKITV